MMYDDGMLGLCEWKNILSTGTVSPWTRSDKRQSRGDKTAPPSPWPLHGQYSVRGRWKARRLPWDSSSSSTCYQRTWFLEMLCILKSKSFWRIDVTRRYHKTYPAVLTAFAHFRSFSIVHSLLESLRVKREETRRSSLLPTLQPEFFTWSSWARPFPLLLSLRLLLVWVSSRSVLILASTCVSSPPRSHMFGNSLEAVQRD